jgi:hypothetical protein
MTVRRSLLPLLSLALGAFTSAQSSHARTGAPEEPAAEEVVLAYRVPSGCPGEAEFVRAVRGRGARFDRAPTGTAGSRLEVSIRMQTEGFAGSVQLQTSAGASEAREVHAFECGEVMQGLAVITALVLHQDSPARTSQSQPTARAPAEASPPTPDNPSEPGSPPALDSHLRSIGQFEDETVAVGAGTLAFQHAFTYSLTGGVAIGVVPALVLPRYDLTLSRTNFVTTPGGSSYLVGGWLPRVRWSVLGGVDSHSGEFSTQVLGLEAGFGGCTSLTYDTRGAVVLVCGELAAGAMQLDTKNGAGEKTQSKTVGLGSAAFELDSQYNVGARLLFELKLGGELGLSKLSAGRPDGSELFHSSPFSAYALAGLGLHF